MDISELIRAAVGVAIVVANWFVYRGVALEESDDPWTKDTGKILLRRALLAETLLALGLVFVDSWISIAQKAEIIRLTTPRELPPDAVKRIESKVCPFGPKPFTWTTVTLDERLFSNELDSIFKACKWRVVGPTDESRDAIIASLSRLVGVRIWYPADHADEFEGVARAFAAALDDEGIRNARAEIIPKDAMPALDEIEFQVGQRP